MKLMKITARQDKRPIWVNPDHVSALMRPDDDEGTAVILQNGVTFIADETLTELRLELEGVTD